MSDDVEMIDPESQADIARQKVASTIDELQDRLDPRRILGDAVGRAQSQGSDLAMQARDLVKAHPLAIGAIGIAIGLALFARSKLADAKVNLGDDFRGYTDYDDGYGAVAIPPVSYDDEAGDDGVPPVRQRVAALAGVATEKVEENPLVSIVLGLAAGAVLGALFPTTEGENRLIKGSGDWLDDAARKAGGPAGISPF